MKSKVVAISAISAGFVALSLIAGAYISVADLFALVVASVFVILPLYYGSYKGAFLAFLAGGVIALLCALPTIAMTVVFPAYAAFFGLYPIVRLWLREKNVHKAVVIAIGIVWCVAAVYGMLGDFRNLEIVANIMTGMQTGVSAVVLDAALGMTVTVFREKNVLRCAVFFIAG